MSAIAVAHFVFHAAKAATTIVIGLVIWTVVSFAAGIVFGLCVRFGMGGDERAASDRNQRCLRRDGGHHE